MRIMARSAKVKTCHKIRRSPPRPQGARLQRKRERTKISTAAATEEMRLEVVPVGDGQALPRKVPEDVITAKNVALSYVPTIEIK